MKKQGQLILIVCLCALMLVNSGFKSEPANEKLVRQYYAAYVKKDWSLLKSILSPKFVFTSPNDKPINLATYHQRCWPNSANTKAFDLEKIMMGKDDAFVTYNDHTNDGRIFRNTEYFKFKDGKIIENDCFFGPGVVFLTAAKNRFGNEH